MIIKTIAQAGKEDWDAGESAGAAWGGAISRLTWYSLATSWISAL